MSYDEHEQIEEQIHFSQIVATFEQYERHSISANLRRRKDFLRLSAEDQRLLEEIGWKKKLNDVDAAIQANARFLNNIVAQPEIFEGREEVEEEDADPTAHEAPPFRHQTSRSGDEEYGQPPRGSHTHSHSHNNTGPQHSHEHTHSHPNSAGSRRARYRPSENDMDKLRSTIKQLVRDWGQEGKPERDACYVPMTNALLEHFSAIPPEERCNIRVLVPGAGLARLALEVARLGFTCQGNEFSHHMLLTSYFILNRTERLHEHTIYPYIHSFSNTRTSDALLRPVTIPDVLPSDIPEGSQFSLVAGDFEEIYGAEENDPRGHESQVGKWDAVLTCFFIDTAKNIINYLRILHRILAPGGLWINLGPLLWHFENNNMDDPSIEVDLVEVKALARKIGFEISEERTIETTYTSDSASMLGYMYKAEFWVARKAFDGKSQPA